MADVVYKSDLDDRAVLAALDRINKNVERVASQGSQSFEKIGKGAGGSALKIGAVTGIVTELTSRFVELGEQAARAFAQVVIGGIKINEEAENIRISLTAIFGGNQDAADAFLDTIDQVAVRLGADRQELRGFAKSILPDVGDIETTVRLTEQARLLGADAGQSFQSTRIAFEEALSGNLSSLQRRLNIGEKYIKQIEAEAAVTGDLATAIANGLQKKVEDSGLAIENFADGFTIAMGTAHAALTDLQQLLTETTFAELTGGLKGVNEAFDNNREEIEGFVLAVGDSLAALAAATGDVITGLIEGIDFQRLEIVAQQIAILIENVRAFTEIITISGDSGSNSLISLANSLIVVNTGLDGMLGLIVQIKAFLEGLNIDNLVLPILAASRGNSIGLAKELENLRKEGIFDQEEYNNVLTEAKQRQGEHNDRLQEYLDLLHERTNATEKDTAAGKAAGEQHLADKNRLEELAAAEQKAADARESIDEKLTAAKVDAARNLTDTLIKFARQQLDDEIKNAQKREDIARKNAEKIADIFRKNQQRVEDAATDLSRDEADIARKAARSREEVEVDAANRRLDIERNYRQELQRIQDQFNQSAAEAERNNDAQAFIAAIRQRDASVTDAQRSRDNDIDAAKIDFEKRREEQRRSLENEIEDARIANERKLEDLQTSLERELEEQRIANERDLAEQTIAEQRQTEARRLSQAQELDDIARHNAQKMADLQTSLEAEYQLIAEYNQKKVENAIATAKAMTDAVRNLFNPSRSASTPEATPTAGTAPTRRGRQSRHGGGGVQAGQTYATLPGELLLTPAQSGYIVPGPSMTGGMGGGMSVDNRRIIENMNVGGTSDAMEVRKIKNIVQQEYLRLMG